MAVSVTMPKLGLTMTEGVLIRWLVADGAEVTKGQPIFEVETDKVVNEAQADADGILRIMVDVGGTVPVMGLVGYILAPGEEMPEEEGVGEPFGTVQEGIAEKPEGWTARVLASPAARRRARELEVDINRIEGTREGGRITFTDVEAPAAKEDRARARRVSASPIAKRMAREAGLDLATVQGSGTGGRITKEDVEGALAKRERDMVGAGIVPAPGDVDVPGGELIPLSGVRAVIAERMLSSAQGTAPVTITSTLDATELVALREQLNRELADGLGFRIAYNDILIKTLATALREFPYMNAHREEGAVRLLPDVHIGLAVDTERGLVVVVVRDADRKSISEIARETRGKAERALAGTITPGARELSGGTFTLINLGAFGVEAFTPIINPPEVAVLGMGCIQEAPMAYQGELVLRQRLVLSLTFDHRFIDGAPAARFLARVRELVEQTE